MQISAKVDYGIRALIFLTKVQAIDAGAFTKAEEIGKAEGISLKFLLGILTELKNAGFVESQRGAIGGYRLSQSASKINLAVIIRALDGPLAAVRGVRPEKVKYSTADGQLQEVWVALRVALRQILENVTLADVANSSLPASVTKLLKDPDAWVSRPT